MKYLIFTVLMLITPTIAHCQDDFPLDLFDLFHPSEIKEATSKDYEEALDTYKKWSENFDDEKFYESLKLRNKLTDELLEIKNLPELDKDVFFLFQADVISNHLVQLKAHWNQEFTDRLTLAATPNSREIAGYINKLEVLRKSHAIRFERKVDEVFEKHKNEIPENERKTYRKNVRNWHIQEKLISE